MFFKVGLLFLLIIYFVLNRTTFSRNFWVCSFSVLNFNTINITISLRNFVREWKNIVFFMKNGSVLRKSKTSKIEVFHEKRWRFGFLFRSPIFFESSAVWELQWCHHCSGIRASPRPRSPWRRRWSKNGPELQKFTKFTTKCFAFYQILIILVKRTVGICKTNIWKWKHD